ncbi:hypothetical protein O181_006149 [Austropuccinia psidii MF-1]|uniref:Uncharacterized protein n=1 Tax=Austropuccinia psidii MF-1 TaxID=1389203 RepID=A0A9Q3GGK4_9BASI|nr:hypothetical protein [Austropuccinia psidii MF-1]
MLNQMGIPHSQYQPALDAILGKYHYHVTQLTNEKDNDKLHTEPILGKKRKTKLNNFNNILLQYSKLPIDKIQERLFANCQNNEVKAYLANHWPMAPEEDIPTYWNISL